MNAPLLNYFRHYEPQLFRFWDSLTGDQRLILESQLQRIDLDILEKQKQLVHNCSSIGADPIEPFDTFSRSGNEEDRNRGEQLIEQGRLGCLLLAGGQGTRLQFAGPKGAYPISLIKNKSLFQLCVEKVKAAGERAGRQLHLSIMTSPDNDKETRLFFQKMNHFGLNPPSISFFKQECLPLLDSEGKLFLQTPWKIASGPNGNGQSLLHLANSGILEKWASEGIEYIHLIPVDNPLADPFDAELLGYHYRQGGEITLKCTEKLNTDEKVGLLVKQNGRCRVIEYTEISAQAKEERQKEGSLKHCCANLSLFCFSLSFIRRIACGNQMLPLHKAWKAAQWIDEKGVSFSSKKPMAWKFETFIFDWLLFAKEAAALVYPREECFAPLKNALGNDSPETVRAALLQRDRKVIEVITGLFSPDFPFELAAEFYYPTPALIAKWKGRGVESGYVEP